MTLQPPQSVDEFQVGDTVECISNGARTRRGEQYLVRDIIAEMDRLVLTDLQGAPIGLHSRWQRFAVVDGDNPNY
jgi:hypothetical protein